MSPEAPERHSRVFLHRCSLEVSAASSGCGWEATLFFLRFDDPETLRAHLEDVGIAYRFSGYDGVDGAWDDVELRVVTVPLPMLVRRTAPPAVAQEVPSLEEAVEACGRLLGAGQVAWQTRGGRGAKRLHGLLRARSSSTRGFRALVSASCSASHRSPLLEPRSRDGLHGRMRTWRGWIGTSRSGCGSVSLSLKEDPRAGEV